MTRLHQAKKEHVESHCTEESNCEHAENLLRLVPWLRPASTQASFEFDQRCCGDPWTTHVFQSGIQVSKGHSGEETLLTKYKIVVRKMKEHPICNALYVQRTVADFLRTRNIDLCHLGSMVDGVGGWFSFTFRKEPSLQDSSWVETAFHGFPLECLASVLTHGLQPSSPHRLGCRIHCDKPGLYFLKDRIHSASSYSRFVADNAGIFFRCAMECRVDRNMLLPCKRKGQWLQPAGSWASVALWVQAVPYEDIENSEYIMPAWFPLLEVPA